MDRSPSSPTIRQSEKLPSSSQPASTRPRSISSQLTGRPLPWALALPPTSLSATIRYYHYTKLQKSQAGNGPEPLSVFGRELGLLGDYRYLVLALWGRGAARAVVSRVRTTWSRLPLCR